MPWHFGRGMYFNRGDCADCDGGTTVDRLMVLTTIYGHQLALASDFGAQGYHIGYTDLGQQNVGGFPLDLSQKDDVTQYMAPSRKSTTTRPGASASRLATWWSTTVHSLSIAARTTRPSTSRRIRLGLSQQTLQAATLEHATIGDTITTNVNALLFIPSLWFKLGWKALTLEFEGNMLAGKMGNAGPLRLDAPTRPGSDASCKLALFLPASSSSTTTRSSSASRLAVQPATRPNWPCDPSKRFRQASTIPTSTTAGSSCPSLTGDSNLNDFHFSPEYHVDEILFRRILGTVTNAIYFKPSIAYWLDLDSRQENDVGISGSVIYSIAPVPVSTPGNSINYGVELDLGLHYRNRRENIYAGATWGIFWPMAALSRPIGNDTQNPLWNSPEDTSASQVIRTFVGIKF